MAEAVCQPTVQSLTLSPWPYPFHLAVSGFQETDAVADVSDEEEPIPGKFVGGKNGRLLRPFKRMKVSTREPSEPLAGDHRFMDVDGTEPQAGQNRDGATEGVATKLKSGFSSLLLNFCQRSAATSPTVDAFLSAPSTIAITARCVISKFGLPPTLYFGHTQPLSQTLPPCPSRFTTADLTVVQRNAAAGLFYRIGPGAVAFRVVMNVFGQSGLSHTQHPTRWNVLWAKRVAPQEWEGASEYQKINHFPGTRGIARKDNLARNILRLKRQHPDGQFGFVPTSYILPQEMQAFETDFRRNGGTWILKPSASSCGKGIRLINSLPVDLGPKARRGDGKDPVPAATWVLQQYIGNPFLINGYKFDLRVYVLVTSFDPLRIYVFNEGLVRFATEKYSLDPTNLSNTFMHLTNYSLNKHSSSYVTPAAAAKAAAAAREARAAKQEEEGEEQESDDDRVEDLPVPNASKWTLSAFGKHCEANGIDWAAIQAQMHDVIIKTFLSVESDVLKEMRAKCQQPQSCFELFGWDLMLDADLKVWLIEVNLMPSLSCTTALDKAVKYALVEETLTLAGPRPYHRRRFEEAANAPGSRCPRMDDITFQDPAQAKALVARLSDPDRPFLDVLSPEHKLLIAESEDEFSRRQHFTRIFPTAKTWAKYGRFFEGPRPNNLVLARWEKEKKKLGPEALSFVKSPKPRSTGAGAKGPKKAA